MRKTNLELTDDGDGVLEVGGGGNDLLLLGVVSHALQVSRAGVVLLFLEKKIRLITPSFKASRSTLSTPIFDRFNVNETKVFV